MADSSILREYLIALGFTVDDASTKKANSALQGIDIKTKGIIKTAITASAAVQAMVTVFSYQMEKMYYASRRTDSTVGNLQALAYGAGQVGMEGRGMQASLEAMARSLRSNPGLTGLLESLGVQVTGRDKADVLLDLVTQLKKMPFYVAEKYAAMFGIDADTLFMLQDGLDKLKEAATLRKQMAADAGVDTEKAAKAGMEYANALREIWERVGLLKDALAIRLLPSFREFAGVTNELLKDWTLLIQRFTSFEDFGKRFMEGVTGQVGGGVELSADAKKRLGLGPGSTAAPPAPNLWQRMMEAKRNLFGGKTQPTAPPVSAPVGAPPPATVGGSNPAALFARLEAKYALPAGWLDRVWKRESARGNPKFMLSPAGAKGHFGFMDATAQQYGVKDPNNLQDSAEGSAKYFADLFRKYKGDAAKAAAAYNWGPGNLDRYGLGRAPKETRDYVGAVAGPTIEQTNHLTVTGVSDPKQAAGLMADALETTNADLLRQLKSRVQ